MKAAPRLTLAYSTAEDGNMSFTWGKKRTQVITNRKAFLRKNNSSLKDTVCMQVVEENIISLVSSGQQGAGMQRPETIIKADAIVTSTAGLGLFLPVADCIPASFYDPVHSVIGLAHLGWQSTQNQLATRLVEFLQTRFDSSAANLVIELGPGIKKNSYLFDSPIQRRLKNGWAPYLTDSPGGQTSIDLYGYNRQQLIDAGVSPGHINESPIDTAKDRRYFSHYRSSRNSEPEGRFAALIKLI